MNQVNAQKHAEGMAKTLGPKWVAKTLQTKGDGAYLAAVVRGHVTIIYTVTGAYSVSFKGAAMAYARTPEEALGKTHEKLWRIAERGSNRYKAFVEATR